jgi:NAD(P)-dependent dehydrogenase (short-subunit alcohol dehydrogenase family)
MRLSGKVAIVTGGGRGIGRAIALQMSREGARLAIAARSEADLAAVAAEIEGLCRNPPDCAQDCAVLPVVTDVRDEASVQNLVEQTLARFGRIDILVNDAGVWIPGPIQEYSLDDWQTTIDTNLRGAFLCTRAVFEPMGRAGGGSIVNISSVWGKERWAGMAEWSAAAYSASKFGVNGLTQALSFEWKRYGIRVNSICPGPVDTGYAQGRPRDDERILPEEIAELAVFLASDESRHITGEAIVVSK